MPDKAKFKKLQEIGYAINPCCALCLHGTFNEGLWGTCDKHKYIHGKHTGRARGVSILLTGGCGSFEPDPESLALLGAHREFFSD